MRLQPLQEEQIRLAIATQCRVVTNTGAVFEEIKRFTSDQDFFKQLRLSGYTAADPHVRFLQIVLDDFWKEKAASSIESLKLRYRINAFHVFFTPSVGEPSSTAIFTAMIINLTNRLEALENIGDFAEARGLDLPIKFLLNDSNEFYKGAYGHHTDLFFNVEIPGCC